MTLNQEGLQRLNAHLQNILRQPCAICGSGSWQVEDKIFEVREFGTDPAGQTSVKPVISMTCNGCGQVVFLSALKTGVIGVAQAPQPQPAELMEEISDQE
jgi:hypothetical protein